MEDRFASLRNATALAVLGREGTTPVGLREAVANGDLSNLPSDLAGLVQKIRTRAYTVTDADLTALRGRYSDDQLFELIVAAAFGTAGERLAAARGALEEA